MIAAKFFDAIRPHFGGKLDQDQVAGMNALLDAGRDLPLHHMANVLAQVRRETGGIMAPIKETVQASHKNRHPTDAEVVRRLDREYAKPGHGGLKHVKTPYWRDTPAWFGRGQIQITHRKNYARFGISNPDDALKPNVSAHVAVAGMRDGLFTGRKLSDYRFPEALASPPNLNPRRIVNGPDGSDAEVARFHRQFATALEAAGWGEPVRMVQQPPRTPEALQDVPEAPRGGIWAWVFNLLRGGK
jgi:hypothetical protein